MSASVDVAPWRRQASQVSEDEPIQSETSPAKTNNVPSSANVPIPPAPPAPPAPPPCSAAPTASPVTPSAPVPPPPPPPSMNGMNIPSMRLKSEISDRLEPPSKLSSAMSKDKKPFTYLPGGIDFSEIKSPRMQRRIALNAQEPEDIVLPPTSSTPVNTNSLPPAAYVGVMPQLAIPVFPTNNPTLKKNAVGRPVSPAQNASGRPTSPAPNVNFGRPTSPAPNVNFGRPTSPAPNVNFGRPASPAPNVNFGRPTSPMPNSGNGRPMSPLPASNNGRPMSPMMPPSNGRPFSPVGRPKSPSTAERPMSPTLGRPMSPVSAYTGGRSISPTPPTSMRPMSPTSNVQYHRPVSPNPPPPPQRTQHLPQHYPTVQTKNPSSNAPVSQNNQIGVQKMIIIPPSDKSRSHTNTIYINNEPTKQQSSSQTTFPTLREAPPPSWLMKHPNQPVQENSAPPWVQRNNEQITRNGESKQFSHEPVTRASPVPMQHNNLPYMSLPNNSAGTHVIPVRVDGGSNQFYHQQNQQQPANIQQQTNAQRFQNNNENMPYINLRPQNKSNFVQSQNTVDNRVPSYPNSQAVHTENDGRPIQSRSFNVIQKITDSQGSDSTDSNSNMPYNTEGVPLSQLRRLHLHDDDQQFMNRVKAQVDDDTFLHMETDPRYRGAAIPSKAFRMLQNMTDAGQVTTNPNATAVNYNHNHHNVTMNSKQPHSKTIYTEIRPSMVMQQNTHQDNEANTKAYIPPSERQAEQELRKYMGSSIPSRSFRMLQAMTATQDTAGRGDETDF